MTNQINQDTINKALWSACDVFRGTISADTYKDFILTMLFLKYISDVWQDHYDGYKSQYGDEPELIVEMMKNERFVLPEQSNFYALSTVLLGLAQKVFRRDPYRSHGLSFCP